MLLGSASERREQRCGVCWVLLSRDLLVCFCINVSIQPFSCMYLYVYVIIHLCILLFIHPSCRILTCSWIHGLIHGGYIVCFAEETLRIKGNDRKRFVCSVVSSFVCVRLFFFIPASMFVSSRYSFHLSSFQGCSATAEVYPPSSGVERSTNDRGKRNRELDRGGGVVTWWCCSSESTFSQPFELNMYQLGSENW